MSIEKMIIKKLKEHLQPEFLFVKNESALHIGSRGAETHFRIEIVSSHFLGKNRLARHRIVQNILENELNLIKAFSLHTFTSEEWDIKKTELERSPACRGTHEN